MANKKDVIICDLDGTLALDDGRAERYLRGPEGKQWDKYFAACGEDLVNEPVKELTRRMSNWYEIHILTGRSEDVLEPTERWLNANEVRYDSLTMRERSDRTDDHVLKPKVARDRGWTKERTLFVIEDRQRVVDAWRELGYTVLQCAPGAF